MNSTRVFWLIIAIIAVGIIFIPVNEKKKAKIETDTKETIYFISDGFFDNTVADKSAEDYLVSLDYSYGNSESLLMNASYGYNKLSNRKNKQLDKLVINLGAGDFYYSNGLYSNEDDSFSNALLQIYTKAKEINPDCKIYFVTDKSTVLMKQKNSRGYSYDDYYYIIKKFCEEKDIYLIDLYAKTQNNPIDEAEGYDDNILAGSYDEQITVIEEILAN